MVSHGATWLRATSFHFRQRASKQSTEWNSEKGPHLGISTQVVSEPHGAVVSQQLGTYSSKKWFQGLLRGWGLTPFWPFHLQWLTVWDPGALTNPTILTCCSKGHSSGADCQTPRGGSTNKEPQEERWSIMYVIPLHHAPLWKSIPPKERTKYCFCSPQQEVIICLRLPSPCPCVPVWKSDCGFMKAKLTKNIMTSSYRIAINHAFTTTDPHPPSVLIQTPSTGWTSNLFYQRIIWIINVIQSTDYDQVIDCSSQHGAHDGVVCSLPPWWTWLAQDSAFPITTAWTLALEMLFHLDPQTNFGLKYTDFG